MTRFMTKAMTKKTSLRLTRFGLLLFALVAVMPLAFAGNHDGNEEAQHDHGHDEAVTDLTPWSGAWVSGWAFGTDAMQPAFDAVMAATPELTMDDILAYYERGNRTDFAEMHVEGENVTFMMDGDPLTCNYAFAGSEAVPQAPGEVWSLFETSEEPCAAYRFLLLNPPHAAEEESSLHFHMRYGDASFDELVEDDGPWFPSLYPADTQADAVTATWSASARAIGLYIAGVLGVEVETTDEEIDEETAALQDSPPEHNHDLTGVRLLVSDASSRDLMVMDLASGELLARFSTPGEASRVYASPSGRYGVAIDRDDNRVTIVHSGLGLVAHGDHADLVQGAPHVLSTVNVGRQPTDIWTGGHHVAIFNDEDGSIAVLDERRFGLSLDFTRVRVAQPDHGAAVVLGDYLLSGYLELGRVDAYTMQGELVESFEGCPRLHGHAVVGDTAAFGCSDGVLLIRHSRDGADALSAVKLDNPPASPEDARVGTVAGHENSRVIVGNFGEGIAIIDPVAGTLRAAPLPERPTSMRFSHGGEHLVLLTADGALHVLEPAGGEVLASLELVELVEVVEGAPRPGLALAEGAIFVSSPGSGEVLEVHFEDGELAVARRLPVPGMPAGIAVLALAGGISH